MYFALFFTLPFETRWKVHYSAKLTPRLAFHPASEIGYSKDAPDRKCEEQNEVLTGVEAVDMHTDLESLFPVEATQLEN